jgi:hypothetical protein
MAFDPYVAAVLSDKVVQNVFGAVLKNRSMLLKDIKDEVGNVASKEDVLGAVQTLRNADLIGEKAAGIADFNTYFVTANGLGAERVLRSVSKSEP